MLKNLPTTPDEIINWTWPEIEPHFKDLEGRTLSADSIHDWLADWSALSDRLQEMYARLHVANTQDTTDAEAERRYHAFLENIFAPAQAADQKLKEKLLASGIEPKGFDVPLRNMRTEAALFREANLPLLTDERKLASEYDKVIGAQTVTWDGQELTLTQLRPVYQETDRARRENAWRMAAERQLADRGAFNALWARFMDLRRQLAANADLPDFRAYAWRRRLRFDYTPDDCKSFHRAIEQVVAPAATRLYEKRRKRLGLDTLRPWDLQVDPLGRPALHPFDDMAELDSKAAPIFYRLDLQLGNYFETMRREGLLDLGNRKGKAPGGYCTHFAFTKRPFIFANAVGIHDDVQTLLHEAGHAFHDFESSPLPYSHLRDVPVEFAEVASMSMELLTAPYLKGSFYAEADAARARLDHLEEIILFWPYMAVVDAFQHWAYENHAAATDAKNCDAAWADLWRRFMPGVDWSGFEDALATGWQRKLHLFRYPFYYIEYGLAQLGAAQVWHNSLHDAPEAVAGYRRALALGGTVTLPELFAAAGARFAFDAETLNKAVSLVEKTIEELEAA